MRNVAWEVRCSLQAAVVHSSALPSRLQFVQKSSLLRELYSRSQKLEHGRPPTPNQRKQQKPHQSCYIDVPSCRSLLATGDSYIVMFWL